MGKKIFKVFHKKVKAQKMIIIFKQGDTKQLTNNLICKYVNCIKVNIQQDKRYIKIYSILFTFGSLNIS